MRASGWVLSVALLVGCQAARPVGPAAEPGEQRSRAGLPATVVRGVVTAPASLIGVDGGTLVGPDGGTLAWLEPGMLIGVDGGTLARPGGWRLSQAGAVPLARTVVLLAGPDGTPLVPRVQTLTDASGRYSLQARGRAGLVVALALTQERRLVRLSGLLHETAAGQVAVSPASTLVSTALIAELAGTPRNFSAVRAADYQTALAGVGPAAAALTPATLTAPEALLAAAREAIGASDGARKGFEAVVARLAAATYDEEAPPSLPAAAPSVAAGGRESSAGQAQRGAPTASPGATPTAAPPPTPASAEGPPSPTPMPQPSPFRLNAKMPAGDCVEESFTGITMAASDTVTLTATGTVTLNRSGLKADPQGLARTLPIPVRCSYPDRKRPLGAALARVGTDGPWHPTGTLPTGLEGPLFLVVNDAVASDNDGYFDVTITIQRETP